MSAMQYRQHVFTELLTNLQVTGWSAVKAPLVSRVQEFKSAVKAEVDRMNAEQDAAEQGC